jgi:hypothetical protein
LTESQAIREREAGKPATNRASIEAIAEGKLEEKTAAEIWNSSA